MTPTSQKAQGEGGRELKRGFEPEFLLERDLPWGTMPVAARVVKDTIEAQKRWTTLHALVFQLPEQFGTDEAWLVTYEEGSTEMQEQGPWEYEDVVPATLVHKVEKVVESWEAVS